MTCPYCLRYVALSILLLLHAGDVGADLVSHLPPQSGDQPGMAANNSELPTTPTQGGWVTPVPYSIEGNVITDPPNINDLTDLGLLLGAGAFYNNGIEGQGSTTANIEAGHIWSGHESLNHVTTFHQDASAWDDPSTVDIHPSDLFDRHATWVGMLIGGRNGGPVQFQGPYQTGIAPQTDLQSGAIASNWNGSAYALGFDFSVDSFVTPYAAAFGTADVINSSWGGVEPTGSDPFAIALDGLAYQNPGTVFVTSAGNSANPPNPPTPPPVPNTVGWPGSAYNGITVAALQNDGNDVYDTVAAFSSRGPQDSGRWDPTANNGDGAIVVDCTGCRAAVDIAAPGTDLVSAWYGGQTGGNNTQLPGSTGFLELPNVYNSNLAGTSFSSPIVAGGAALLHSTSYNTAGLNTPAAHDARVIKAVLLNSADKIPGWDNGQSAHPNGNGGVHTTQSLDYTSGAGALNLAAAFNQFTGPHVTTDVTGARRSGNMGKVEITGWDFGTVTMGTDNIYEIDDPLQSGSMLTVTLAWFRDRSFDSTTADFADNAQADLDLSVWDTTNNRLISESNSDYNVVEHLHFIIPDNADYIIQVEFDGVTFDNLAGLPGATTSADYGLAWSVTAIPEPSAFLYGGLVVVLVAYGARITRRRPKAVV